MSPANDNGNEPDIRIDIGESSPLNVIEVEIFDALISNIAGLVANDNELSPAKETKP